MSVIEIHSFLDQTLVNSRSVSEAVEQLRQLAITALALVTRDLILAFPVTYLAKTRLNLL